MKCMPITLGDELDILESTTSPNGENHISLNYRGHAFCPSFRNARSNPLLLQSFTKQLLKLPGHQSILMYTFIL